MLLYFVNFLKLCLPRREAGKYITATIARDKADDDGVPRRSCKSSTKSRRTGSFLPLVIFFHRRRWKIGFDTFSDVSATMSLRGSLTETNLLYKRHEETSHAVTLDKFLLSSGPMRRTKRNGSLEGRHVFLDRDSEKFLSFSLLLGSCSVRSIITSSNSAFGLGVTPIKFPRAKLSRCLRFN